MFDWFSLSMTKKVGGLSFILLSFLFVVILFSAYQSQRIYYNMMEVAEIDVPLSEIVAEVEVIQLRQDLFIESLQWHPHATSFNSPMVELQLNDQTEQDFRTFNQALASQLFKAEKVLHNALTLGSVRLKMTDHQALMEKVGLLHKHRIAFEKTLNKAFRTQSMSLQDWSVLEDIDQKLEYESDRMLRMIDVLTMRVSDAVEEQEHRFVLINAMLGISALAIGTYLTLYIILSFRKRVWSLRGQIHHLHHALSTESNPQREHLKSNNMRTKDELDELEDDLQILLSRFSSEIDNRQQIENELIELATRDKLTGAYNRRKWDEQMQAVLHLAHQGYAFSVILIDVDYFKKVNDTQGHDVGDKVLKVLVTELNRLLKPQRDSLFRLGGEEFAVLLKSGDSDDAKQLAEQLRHHIETFSQPDLPAITISLGVTGYQEGDTRQSLVKRVDQLLYEAKAAGRNQVVSD